MAENNMFELKIISPEEMFYEGEASFLEFTSVGGSQKLLLPLYHQFHDWMLEYDLEKIDQMFAPAKE